jgi:hypothetical protein
MKSVDPVMVARQETNDPRSHACTSMELIVGQQRTRFRSRCSLLLMCMRSSSVGRRLKTRRWRRMKKLGSRNKGIPQPSSEERPPLPRLRPHRQHQTDERTSRMRQCYFSPFSLSSPLLHLCVFAHLLLNFSLYLHERSVRSYRSTIHAFFHLSFSYLCLYHLCIYALACLDGTTTGRRRRERR